MVFMMLSNFNFKVFILILDKIAVNVLKFHTLFLSDLKQKIGFPRSVLMQPIIALYFESETVLKFYNLETWHSQNVCQNSKQGGP